MLFLLLFLFFYSVFTFIFYFFFSVFFIFFVIDVVQHNGVMLLGCFMIFFSSSFFPFFFSFFLFVVSLKRRNIVLLFLFECFSNLFCTKRFSLYQVSVSGIIPSSLYLGLGPAGSRKKPCNRSWRSYSLKKKNKKNNDNIIIGKIFQISLSNSGANRIGLHQLWAKWRSF